MMPPWKFIPLQEYHGPKNGGSAGPGFWRELAGCCRRDREASSVSDEILAPTVQHPNWDGMVAALAEVLSYPKGMKQGKHQVRAVVGPPGSRVCEATLGWAEKHGACVVSPPTSEQILASPDWWHNVRDHSADVLVIPQLERCFLRHHDGLTGLRQLLQWLWSNPRPIVVGCDSWAWAYLIRALHVDAVFHQPLAPASFEVTVSGAVSMPAMPDARGSVQALVLHALLIHNGLRADVLLGLLPFQTSQIMAGVAWLENHRLVENTQDRWQVSPNAYVSARRFLGDEGFLVDTF